MIKDEVIEVHTDDGFKKYVPYDSVERLVIQYGRTNEVLNRLLQSLPANEVKAIREFLKTGVWSK